MTTSPVNRNAIPAVFGFEFQEIAGLILTLANIKDVEEISIEAPHQDIELLLSNNKKIYAQAKATTKPYNATTFGEFKSGVKTLIENAELNDFEKFIYVTNSIYPLGKKAKTGMFFDEHSRSSNCSISELRNNGIKIDEFIDKVKIEGDNKFDRELLEIQFYKLMDVDDHKAKYEVVYESIQEFLEKINGGKCKNDIFELWTGQFHRNSTQRQVIKKKDFIWKMIVKLSSIDDTEAFKEFFDYDTDEFEEIEERFIDEIDKLTNGFEISNLIITEYTSFRRNTPKRDREFNFINAYWEKFQDQIMILSDDAETQKLVCQLVIWKIITSKRIIKKSKEVAGIS